MAHNDGFRIIIVGGGIAGLFTAIALRGPNRTITVLERSRMLRETGALISLQPNASKIVTRLGVDRFLESAEPQADRGFRLFDIKGNLTTEVALETDQFGADRVLYHRQDLHTGLRNAAVSPELAGKPVEIHTSANVVSVDAEEGSVMLEGGETLQADLLIGADGIKSVVRDAVLDEPRRAIPTGIAAYRLLFPSSLLENIKDVPKGIRTLEPAYTTMVVGNDRRVIMGPGRGGKLFGIVALVPDSMKDNDGDSWVMAGSRQELLAAYEGFPSWLLDIFTAAPESDIGLWQLRDIDPLPTWVRGQTILIGDAAHAMLPTQGQGASQAIEDAEALQAFLSNISGTPSKEEISQALENVFKARFDRASLIQSYSRQQAKPGTEKGSTRVTLNPGQFLAYNCNYDGAKDWLSRQEK